MNRTHVRPAGNPMQAGEHRRGTTSNGGANFTTPAIPETPRSFDDADENEHADPQQAGQMYEEPSIIASTDWLSWRSCCRSRRARWLPS